MSNSASMLETHWIKFISKKFLASLYFKYLSHSLLPVQILPPSISLFHKAFSSYNRPQSFSHLNTVYTVKIFKISNKTGSSMLHINSLFLLSALLTWFLTVRASYSSLLRMPCIISGPTATIKNKI